jgi:hypothetical protein
MLLTLLAAADGGAVTVSPGTGIVTVAGFASALSASATASPGTGSVTLAGYAPEVSAGSSVSATVSSGEQRQQHL